MAKRKKSPRKKSPEDLKSMVDEILNANHYAGRCPVLQMPDQAKELFGAMVHAETQGNRKVSRKKLRQVLLREFDIRLSGYQLSKHFRGECNECKETNLNAS